MNYLNNNRRIVELCGGTYGKNHSGSIFYPYQYIYETVQDAKCYVCFDVSASYSPLNSTFQNMTIYFWPTCHLDIAVMKDAPGLRYDLIAHEITKDWANQDQIGIGKSQIVYNDIYVVSDKIRGRAIQVSLFDISQEAYNRHAQSFVQ